MDGLNNAGKALKGSRILVLGIAYKKNVDDMRESPSVEIMELIEAKGGIVAYSDPHVPVFPKMREHHFDLRSEPLTADNLASFDAVLLTTDHDKFDYELIKTQAKLIIDSRGKYRAPAEHIIKA
ncbi:UDP-N-acetyl-D-glucosamine 6-dehydrogenase [compost metagenome]